MVKHLGNGNNISIINNTPCINKYWIAIRFTSFQLVFSIYLAIYVSINYQDNTGSFIYSVHLDITIKYKPYWEYAEYLEKCDRVIHDC